jgi:hypothetical protein
MDGLSVEKVNICVLYQMNHKRHFEIVVIQIHIFFLGKYMCIVSNESQKAF